MDKKPDQYTALLTARKYYQKGKFQEGWDYVLKYSDCFTPKQLHKIFDAFAAKIEGIKK